VRRLNRLKAHLKLLSDSMSRDEKLRLVSAIESQTDEVRQIELNYC